MSLLSGPKTVAFKPYAYEWAYEYWLLQNKIHWLPEEAPMAQDVKDWHSKLSVDEQHLLTHIFRFFVQADISVNDAYSNHYVPRFKHQEILMMLKAFSSTESLHVVSYSHLIDTLGMPETIYSIFLEYKEMVDKYEYYATQNSDDLHGLLKTIAIFAAFTEGLQLYSSFAILLNFPRFNKMKGMGQIISWSARDESLHCQGMLKLYHTLLEENPGAKTKRLEKDITTACRTIIHHEDAYINLAFKDLKIEGLDATGMKTYIRYIADRRMVELHYNPIFGQLKNPFPWMDEQLNNIEYSNFFETRPTEYSKGTLTGEWDNEAFEAGFA